MKRILFLSLLLSALPPAWALEGPCSVLVRLEWGEAQPGSVYLDREEGFAFNLKDTAGTRLEWNKDYHAALPPDFELQPGSAKARVGTRADKLTEWQLTRSLFFFDLRPGTSEVEVMNLEVRFLGTNKTTHSFSRVCRSS